MSSALLALLQQKKQDIAAQRKGSTEKLNEGTTTIRVMGSWKGADEAFWHDFGKHFVKDATGKLAESYICTKKTFGTPCAICDAVADAKSKNLPEALAKLVGDSAAGGRVLVNAINPNHPKEPHKVHIYELPSTVFSQIIDSATQYMQMGVELIGPAGRDLYITRTGKGMNTKYSITIAPVSTPIPEIKPADIHNLDEFVSQESSEQRARTLSAFNALLGSPVPAGLSLGGAAGLPAGLLAGSTAPALTGASPAAAGPTPAEVQAEMLRQQQHAQALLQQQQATAALAAQQAAAKQAAEQAAMIQQQQAALAAQQQAALAAQQQAAAQQAAAQQAAAQQAAAQQAALAAQQAAALAAQQPAAASFEDIPDSVVMAGLNPAATVTMTPAAAAQLAPIASTGDADLDALLADLG